MFGKMIVRAEGTARGMRSMVSCKHCSTPNTLDSTFCKRCGTAIPKDDVDDATTQLDAFVAKGEAALDEGRTDEALAIADSAIHTNPSSIRALSLKSVCHERLGQIAPALEAVERVVDLNPDSELDKIRRNQLRNALEHHSVAFVRKDRRLAVAGALSAVVIVMGLGALAAAVGQRNVDSKPKSDRSIVRQAFEPATLPNSQSGAAKAPPTEQSEAAPAGGTGDNTYQVRNGESSHRSSARSDGDPLPFPRADAASYQQDMQVEPFHPNITPIVSSQSDAAKPTAPPPNKTKAVDPPPEATPNQPATEDSGVIDIQVHKGAGSGPGGSESIGGSGLEALVRTGRQQLLIGNYAAAAGTYERALRNGGDPVSINQRLGQAYSHSGRTSDAIEAYGRAIAAGESMMGPGKGGNSRVQAAVDSCKAALKALQGG